MTCAKTLPRWVRRWSTGWFSTGGRRPLRRSDRGVADRRDSLRIGSLNRTNPATHRLKFHPRAAGSQPPRPFLVSRPIGGAAPPGVDGRSTRKGGVSRRLREKCERNQSRRLEASEPNQRGRVSPQEPLRIRWNASPGRPGCTCRDDPCAIGRATTLGAPGLADRQHGGIVAGRRITRRILCQTEEGRGRVASERA